MDKLVWNDKLNIGVEIIDNAHANLFHIAGKVSDLVEYEASYRNACKEGLRYLEDYTMKHFSEEEAYMRSIRYRGYARHKQIHDTFRDQTLVSLKKTLELSDYSPAAAHRFLGVLLGWLTGHIMAEDQDITGQRSPAPVYAYSFDTSIIAQAIDHTMQDVFRMEANLINNSYDGRKMGMGFFCRLCYTMSNGGKIQLLFAAEEQLLRRAVGLIFGLHAMRNAEMVHEVSLQIFEQFLHHMGRLFKSDATYELYKEEVLTGDEFRSDFMTRYPCSLLFETRLGYFVFCARKWQARGRKVFVP